jgi:hypothetical protein
VPGAQIIPMAIRYEMAMHERPEAFIAFGQPLSEPRETQAAVEKLLAEITLQIREDKEGFSLLAPGTPDVNERWSMRRR